VCVLRPISNFIMKKKLICVKVCVELGKTAPYAHEMLKTSFGDITMGRTWIYRGFLDSNVEKTAKGRKRGGRSSTVSGDEKLQRVRKIVKEERRSTISEIIGRFGLSYGTRQWNLREALYMLTDLRELSDSQAHRRVRNSRNF